MYLTNLSYIGGYFDHTGCTRVHALSLDFGGRAVLLLLPSSDGKTTMALRMLQVNGIRIISKDSAIKRRNGLIKPFPFRIGVRPGNTVPDVIESMLLDIKGREFRIQRLIDIEAFSEKTSEPVPSSAILLGTHFSAGEPKIVPGSRRKTIRPLISHAVVGLVLYPGVEVVLQSQHGNYLKRVGWHVHGCRSRLPNCLEC